MIRSLPAAAWALGVLAVVAAAAPAHLRDLAQTWWPGEGASAWPGAPAFGRHWLGVTGAGVAAIAGWFGTAGAGRRLLGWAGWAGLLPPVARPAGCFIAGFAVLAGISSGLGLAGLLTAPVEAVAAGSLALAAAFELRRVARRPPAGAPAGPAGVLVGLIVSLAVPWLVLSGIPEQTEDALAYHFAAPEYFRAQHKVVDAPHLQYRWPLLVEQVPALFATTAGPHVAGMLFLVAIAVLAAGMAGAGARASAVLVVVGSGGAASLAAIQKPDLAAAGFALLALAALEAGRDRPARRRPAWTLAGAAIGWMACAKLSTAALAPGLLLAALLAGAPVGRLALAGGAAAGLAALPWLLRTWWLTGNPFYPAGWGGLGWAPGYGAAVVATEWFGGAPPERDPIALAKLILADVIRNFPLVVLGLPLLALAPRPAGSRPGAGLAPVAAAVALAVWCVAAPRPRYMMAGWLVLAPPAARGLAAGAALAGSRRWTAPVVLGLTACLGLLPALAGLHRAGPAPKPLLPAALGLESADAFHARTLGSYWRMAGWLRANTTAADRILVHGDIRGGGLAPGRRVMTRDIADLDLIGETLRAAPRDPRRFAARLRQSGATVVAYNFLGALRLARLRDRAGLGVPGDPVGTWAGWCRAHLDEAYADPRPDQRNGHWVVWRLRPGGGRPPSFLPGFEAPLNPVQAADGPEQVRRLTRLHADAPGIAAIRSRLGELLAVERRWREAAPHLEAAVNSGALPATVHLNLAVVLERLGRTRDTEAVLRAGARRFPEEPRFTEWLRP